MKTNCICSHFLVVVVVFLVLFEFFGRVEGGVGDGCGCCWPHPCNYKSKASAIKFTNEIYFIACMAIYKSCDVIKGNKCRHTVHSYEMPSAPHPKQRKKEKRMLRVCSLCVRQFSKQSHVVLKHIEDSHK